MVEKNYKKEKKIEFDVGWYENLLEDKKNIEKYGLSKKEFEKSLQDDLKLSNSFWVVASYLQWSRSLIEEGKVKECGHFIERAKYVLRGCKEGPISDPLHPPR